MRRPPEMPSAGCASRLSGRAPGGRRRPGRGPICSLALLLACVWSIGAWAQAATPAKAPTKAPAESPAARSAATKGSKAGAPPAKAPARPEWRDTTGYRFPAVGKTVTDMQNAAHAMRLREYCADARVKDEFVRERLERFSAITGRKETCRTLLDY